MIDDSAAQLKRIQIETTRQTDLLYRICAQLALVNILIGFALLCVIFFGVPAS